MEIMALAPARALEFALEVGISQSILERDSKVIMKALVEEGRSLTPYDLLVQDARIFSRFFTQLLYSHSKKECNKVAHSLTRESKTMEGSITIGPPATGKNLLAKAIAAEAK
nr:hypothetical protein CFP56_74882 [Quercus suber]